jgi:hypothetical protein
MKVSEILNIKELNAEVGLIGIKSNLNGGLPAGCNSTEARLI